MPPVEALAHNCSVYEQEGVAGALEVLLGLGVAVHNDKLELTHTQMAQLMRELRESSAVTAWSKGMDLYGRSPVAHDSREVGSLCAQAIRQLHR